MVIPMMSRNPDILFITEYIKNVLYFATVRPGKVLKNTSDIVYLCTDKELVYENYYSDFGPLNLGCVYKFCKILNEKLKDSLNKQTVVYYTSVDSKKKTNAAFLLGCYGVLYMNLLPKEALKPMTLHGQTYRAFQDATQGESNYTISVLDCLQAIKKARDLGFFNFQDFNYEEYVRLDKIQGGDLNWIVPGKYLAFIGPVDCSVSLYHPPEMYIEYFRENNVQIVIRLNKRMYDGNVFAKAGITHYDLFFHDGTCPPRHILVRFLQISEEADGAIAVHCKAGLGRTGSLIGSYLIKHYRMTAHEAIGWMRICRPGSVIGHQQAWLEQLEQWLIKQGNIYRKRIYHDTERLPVHEYGIYSISEKATKQRLVLTGKPSPQIQRQTRSDTSPPTRPNSSRTREVPNKTPEKEQSESRVRIARIIAKSAPKGDLNRPSSGSVSRRGSGAGDPRPTPRSTSRSTVTPISSKDKSNNDLYARTYGMYPPLPAFQAPHNIAFRSFKDAKAYLLKPNAYEQREKQLNSSITVTPHSPSQFHRSHNYVNENIVSAFTSNNRHSTPHQVPGSKCQSQPYTRRRLGRSPSPSPSSSPTRHSEQNRATNTPHSMDKYLVDDNYSKSTLREALSRLKLTTHRDGSVGAASLGAASLGARRKAPADKRAQQAPSVRSDERPTATQGDMLNSIKFQRRFRETLNAEKNSTAIQHKESNILTAKPRASGAASGAAPVSPKTGVQPRAGSNDSRWATARPTSPTKERPIPTAVASRFGGGCSKAGMNADNAAQASTALRPALYPPAGRPSSPKPRRTPPSYY